MAGNENGEALEVFSTDISVPDARIKSSKNGVPPFSLFNCSASINGIFQCGLGGQKLYNGEKRP